MNIRAVLFALPRLELNRLEEWVDIMMQKGINSLSICSHCPSYKIWWKKPNSKYYNLELSDDELHDKWECLLDKISKLLPLDLFKIETFGPNEDLERARSQINFVNNELIRAIDDGIDWIIHCDVDEIPDSNLIDVIENNPNTSIFKSNQVVFESSFFNSIRNIKRYHPKKIFESKCLVDPKKCSFKNMHVAIPNTDNDLIVRDAFLIHHFRGIEKSSFEPLNRIDSFPYITDDSTSPVHLENC